MRTIFQAGLLPALLGGLLLGAVRAPAEPGHGSIATALPIDFSAFGSPNYAGGSGQLSLPGEQDYYAFQVYTGGYLQYGVGGLGSGSSLTLPNPQIDLFDASDTQISSIGGYLYAVTPGIYYPRLQSATGGTGTYNWSLEGQGQGAFGSATFGRILPSAAVPEAGTLPLLALGLGGVLLAVGRRRRG